MLRANFFVSAHACIHTLTHTQATGGGNPPVISEFLNVNTTIPLLFVLSNLEAFVEYSVQAVARYRVMFDATQENRSGEPTIVMTAG